MTGRGGQSSAHSYEYLAPVAVSSTAPVLIPAAIPLSAGVSAVRIPLTAAVHGADSKTGTRQEMSRVNVTFASKGPEVLIM